MTTVAAVVVTYNRKAIALRAVMSLLEQVRPLDRIYLIDNASTDNTGQYLSEHGILDHESVSYVRMEVNTGGAGGFHEGLRLATSGGYDWIWIMDDDCEVDQNALKIMMAHTSDSLVAILPSVTTSQGELDRTGAPHRGFFRPPGEVRDRQLGRHLTDDEVSAGATLEIDYYTFVGPCFSRRAVEAVGLPLKEFFIHYDDTEYCKRISTQGPALLVFAAKITNYNAVGSSSIERTLLGRRSIRWRYDALWLRYYGYRNYIWLVTRGKFNVSFVRLVIDHLRLLGGVVLFDDHKLRRLLFWNLSLLDGLRGTFDNARPRRVTSLAR